VSAFGPESRMQGMIENVRRLNEENAKLRELLAECKERLGRIDITFQVIEHRLERDFLADHKYNNRVLQKRIEEALKNG